MKKPHGLTGKPSNARKDSAPRTGRLSLRLPPEVDATLAARAGPGCTKSDAALQILRRGLECWCPRCESSVLPVDGKGDISCQLKAVQRYRAAFMMAILLSVNGG